MDSDGHQPALSSLLKLVGVQVGFVVVGAYLILEIPDLQLYGVIALFVSLQVFTQESITG